MRPRCSNLASGPLGGNLAQARDPVAGFGSPVCLWTSWMLESKSDGAEHLGLQMTLRSTLRNGLFMELCGGVAEHAARSQHGKLGLKCCFSHPHWQWCIPGRRPSRYPSPLCAPGDFCGQQHSSRMPPKVGCNAPKSRNRIITRPISFEATDHQPLD